MLLTFITVAYGSVFLTSGCYGSRVKGYGGVITLFIIIPLNLRMTSSASASSGL